MSQRKTQPPDRRIEKTRKLLHDALLSLLHEKSYDDIVVKEILDRANVGRSTFYTHYRDKDDLLAGGVRDLLHSFQAAKLHPSPKEPEGIVWFSLPIFEHIDEHRRTSKLRIGRRGQIILHEHLQEILVELISGRVKSELKNRVKSSSQIPPDLLVQHLASTFILVLNWWVDRNSSLAPAEVDAVFRALIGPVLR
jgi:AcrR family transcriptional regulator